MLLNEKIDICCLQEIELKNDVDHELLSFPGYSLMVENNNVKSRVGIYIRNEIQYRLSIQLYKLYNTMTPDGNEDWIDLNFQQNFNERNNHVQIYEVSRLRIGRNTIVNRLKCLNNSIDYDWLNQSLNTFKVKSKMKFLST